MAVSISRGNGVQMLDLTLVKVLSPILTTLLLLVGSRVVPETARTGHNYEEKGSPLAKATPMESSESQDSDLDLDSAFTGEPVQEAEHAGQGGVGWGGRGGGRGVHGGLFS